MKTPYLATVTCEGGDSWYIVNKYGKTFEFQKCRLERRG